MNSRERIERYLNAIQHEGDPDKTVIARVLTPEGGHDLTYGDVSRLLRDTWGQHVPPEGAICFDTAGRSAVAILWGTGDSYTGGALFFDDTPDDHFQRLPLTPLERALMAERLRYAAERLLDKPRLLLPTGDQ